jgi:3-oxoacyl-(acyl-carrier-protein) synthase
MKYGQAISTGKNFCPSTTNRLCSVSAVDAWTDAGFALKDDDDDTVDWDTGVIAGSGMAAWIRLPIPSFL